MEKILKKNSFPFQKPSHYATNLKICKCHLRFYHPKLRQMTCRIGVFGTKGGPKGIGVALGIEESVGGDMEHRIQKPAPHSYWALNAWWQHMTHHHGSSLSLSLSSLSSLLSLSYTNHNPSSSSFVIHNTPYTIQNPIQYVTRHTFYVTDTTVVKNILHITHDKDGE